MRQFQPLGMARLAGSAGGEMMKGASNFDKLCHQVFDGKSDGTNYLARETEICCGTCGHKLRAYYCEEGLHLIECAVCGTKALTKAKNVVFAAHKTLAHGTRSRTTD